MSGTSLASAMRRLSRVPSFLIPVVALLALVFLVVPPVTRRVARFEQLFPRILATELSYYLSQYLARPVAISSVLIDRKHQTVQFLGVTVERRPNEIGPAMAIVDRIVVHYYPNFLTLHLFDPMSSIGDIEVYHPVLFVVHSRTGQWNVLNIGRPRPRTSKTGVPFTANIHVFNAAATYLDLQPPHSPPSVFTASANGANGTIVLQKNGPVRWTMDAWGAPARPGASPVFHHARVDGVVDTGDNTADINVVADHGNLALVLAAYTHFDFANLSSADGGGILNFQRPPPDAHGVATWQYTIDADFKGLNGTVRGIPLPIRNASGHIALANETAQFRIDGADYGPAHVSGSGVLVGFHNPIINGTFTAARVSEGVIYPFIPAAQRSAIRLLAPSSGMVTLEGPLLRPDISGRLNTPAAIVENIRIGEATLGFTYIGGRVSVSQVAFRVGGGWVDLTGNVISTPQGPTVRLSGYVRNIDLASLPLPAALQKYHPTGLLTGNLRLNGAGGAYSIATTFGAQNTTVYYNGSPYFFRAASGTLLASSSGGGAASVSTRLTADGLQTILKGERYTANGLSAVVNARVGSAGLQSLTTQGALAHLGGRGLDLKSATWNIVPGTPGQDLVELSVNDPTGELQLAGTATSNLNSFNLHALARNVQVASLGGFVPALKPVGGLAFISGTLIGSMVQPQFDGQVQVLGVTYAGMTFDRIHGGMTVNASGAQFRNITMHVFPGEIVLNGAVTMDNYHPTDTNLELTANDLSLSRLASMRNMHLPLTGNFGGRMAIHGPLEHLLIAGRLNVQNGVLANYPVSSATAEFRYEPDLQQLRSGAALPQLLAGLELTSVTANSPDATFTLAGGRIGQDGRLNMHADLTNIAFLDLWDSLTGKQELHPQILPLQNGRIALQVSGTVNSPLVVAQIPPTLVDVNGQKLEISARNLSFIPRVSTSTASGHASSMALASLSVDRVLLQQIDPNGDRGGMIQLEGPAPNQTARLLPHVLAAVEVSGMNLDTVAGLARQSLPAGVSGFVSQGRMALAGDLPLPNDSGQPLKLLTGTASLTLQDIAMIPPGRGPIIPVPYTIAPPAATPDVPSAPGTPTVPGTIPASAPAPGHTILAASRKDRRKTPKKVIPPAEPAVSDVTITPPAARGVHFSIGQLNARLEGRRITLDAAYLHEFDSATAPGLRLEIAPGSYYDMGGGMALTAEAPGIPMSVVNQLFPLFSPPRPSGGSSQAAGSQLADVVNRLNGAVHLTARVTQPTEDVAGRALILSIDPSISAPLTYSGRPLIARAIIQAVEGSLSLRSLAFGTRIGSVEHLITGEGSIPFTWTGANHITPDGELKFHAQLAGDNLSALQALAPDLVQSATGSLTAELTIGGTLKTPRVFGAILVGKTEPGKLLLQHIEQPLQKVQLAINFDDQQATIVGDAASDKGTMGVHGTAQVPGANRPGTIALVFNTNGFHLTDQGFYADTAYRGVVPDPKRLKQLYEQVYGYVDSNLNINGTLESPLVTGKVTLRNADLRYGGTPENAPVSTAVHSINPRFNLTLALGNPALKGKDITVTHTSLAKLNPYGSFKVTGDLNHPVLDGDVEIRKGGYLSYVLELWRIEQATAHVHFEPPLIPGDTGLKLNMQGILTTQIEEQGTRATAFFASSGQLLHVQMQVIGDPLVQGGFHVMLSSDPARSESQLRTLLFHTDLLQNLVGGNLEGQVPGLFNEALRTTLVGNVLHPLETQLASVLGLEEVNLEYQFGGPLYLQITKHWFDGVNVRLRREVTADTQEYQLYLDYRIKGNFNLSFGLLRRPTYTEQSFTLQTFFRF